MIQVPPGMCTLVLWGGILGEAGSGATIVFDVCRGSSGVYELIAAAPGMRAAWDIFLRCGYA